MRRFLAFLFLALLATPAAAQPWYARGSFNGWSLDHPMTDQGGGHWTASVTGLFDNEPFMFKIAEEDWSPNMPGSDARVYTDALGEIHFHLWDNTSWNDGWLPNNVRRVGYDDHQQFDWQLMGSFNGWQEDSAFYLTDMGNGLHSGTFAMPAGIFDYKFRRQDSWDTSIGNDFGNGAGNNSFSVLNAGDLWTFELDLPNGRFRSFAAAPPSPDGDYNNDGSVDAADYVIWRKTDAGNAAGYDEWRQNFGGGSTPLSWIARATQAGDTWQETLTDPNNDGVYTVTRTGLTPGSDHELQVIRSDASSMIPGNPGVKVRADDNGEITLNFFELSGSEWGDGWAPNDQHRLGYADHDQFDWEIVGSFNDWPGSNDPAFALTDQGSGLHTGTFTFDTPGEYVFKFRHIDETNPWNISIGGNGTFNNSGSDIPLSITNAGEQWSFELDLPNGRWRAFLNSGSAAASAAVPEPASVALAMLGALALLGVTGRKRRV